MTPGCASFGAAASASLVRDFLRALEQPSRCSADCLEQCVGRCLVHDLERSTAPLAVDAPRAPRRSAALEQPLPRAGPRAALPARTGSILCSVRAALASLARDLSRCELAARAQPRLALAGAPHGPRASLRRALLARATLTPLLGRVGLRAREKEGEGETSLFGNATGVTDCQPRGEGSGAERVSARDASYRGRIAPSYVALKPPHSRGLATLALATSFAPDVARSNHAGDKVSQRLS